MKRAIRDVLRRNRAAIILWIVFIVVGLVTFTLYGVMLEPLIYAAVLTFIILGVVLVFDTVRSTKHLNELSDKVSSIEFSHGSLPDAESSAEEEYRKMIDVLTDRLEELTTEYDEERQDSIDYYTAWVHQIKTPIAVMKLKLADDTPANRAMSLELFRIEQYVDMVLQYIRLGSNTNDLVVEEYSLDELIRETVRKFAEQFIEKKIRLEYASTSQKVVTDRKWFTCILEQFISNAIKYTSLGTVSIECTDLRLKVSDTGIGIAKEDLPRIFEKGYTGHNGRLGEKSSGLGLYLAKKAADMLDMKLEVESTVGEGSSFSIVFTQTPFGQNEKQNTTP